MFTRLIPLFALSLTAFAVPAFADPAKILKVAEPVPDEYIVTFKDGVARDPKSATDPRPSAPSIANELTRGLGGELLFTYEHALSGFAVKLDEKQIEELAKDPRVGKIEENGVTYTGAVQYSPPWGLDRVDQRALPLNGEYDSWTTASNVHVFIVDTGLRTSHGEFTGRVGAGYTSIADGNGVNDCNGHGTHVAGTAVGTTYGVAKGARLYPVRVLGCGGTGTWAQFAAGLDWIIANSHLRPAVANASIWGGTNTTADDAVRRLVNAGVTFVGIAGNANGANACNYSPGRVSQAITVAATSSNDARASFSNIGTCVDLFAPGDSILSAYHRTDSDSNWLSGTSMAAPHVAGAVALYLADRPGAAPATVDTAVKNKATQGVVGNAGSGSPNRLLYTRFDADEPPRVNSVYGYCYGFNCDFSVSAWDDNGIVAYDWDYGDGSVESGSSYAFHAYSWYGWYWVTVRVWDGAGQQAVGGTYVEVKDPFQCCPSGQFCDICIAPFGPGFTE